MPGLGRRAACPATAPARRPRSWRLTCRAPRRCANLWERRDESRRRAIGSAGERLVHTEEVTGSIPVSPTRSEAMSILVRIMVGAIPVAKRSANLYAAAHDGQARLGRRQYLLRSLRRLPRP